MKQLDHKVAIITRAGSGIGKETALPFGPADAKVVTCPFSENRKKA